MLAPEARWQPSIGGYHSTNPYNPPLDSEIVCGAYSDVFHGPWVWWLSPSSWIVGTGLVCGPIGIWLCF